MTNPNKQRICKITITLQIQLKLTFLNFGVQILIHGKNFRYSAAGIWMKYVVISRKICEFSLLKERVLYICIEDIEAYSILQELLFIFLASFLANFLGLV